MKTDKPLLNKNYLLEKFPGKGGWTYAAIPEIPEEFMVCLLEDQVAHKTFISLSDGDQKKFINWIYSAKTDDTKVERMAETMNRLVTGNFSGDK